jgi:hypothetical protein
MVPEAAHFCLLPAMPQQRSNIPTIASNNGLGSIILRTGGLAQTEDRSKSCTFGQVIAGPPGS